MSLDGLQLNLQRHLSQSLALATANCPPAMLANSLYALAVAVGECHLQGSSPGEVCLTPEQATLAAGVAREQIAFYRSKWSAGFPALLQRASHDGAMATTSVATDPIFLRMELWAVFVALDDACEKHDAETGSGPELAGLRAAMDNLMADIDALDNFLQDNLEHLKPAGQTALLQNFRNMLRSPYNLRLPWWLDGRLEMWLTRTTWPSH